MLTWFVVVSTILFLFFAIIWTTEGVLNVILKMVFILAFLLGTAILWEHFVLDNQILTCSMILVLAPDGSIQTIEDTVNYDTD